MVPPQTTDRPVSHRAFVYNDELELVRTIGEFATAALERGGAVVLIAESRHLEAADQWIRLSRAGSAPDEPAPPVAGSYQTYDADALVDGLCLSTDPAGTFGGLLDEALGRVPPGTDVVHIYGDLVGRLWGRGQANVALAVEQVGNGLARDRSVAILCAYPAGVMTDPDHLTSIRDCHSEFLEGPVEHAPAAVPNGTRVDDAVSRANVFPSSISACRAARRFVRRAVEECGSDDELADAAELVCSELAANAVRHAHSVFTVRVVCESDAVRVSVADEARASSKGPDEDGPAPFPVGAARGLGIVSALAFDWGVDEDGSGGKVVWAALGRAQGAA